jgi:hypothetical protein
VRQPAGRPGVPPADGPEAGGKDRAGRTYRDARPERENLRAARHPRARCRAARRPGSAAGRRRGGRAGPAEQRTVRPRGLATDARRRRGPRAWRAAAPGLRAASRLGAWYEAPRGQGRRRPGSPGRYGSYPRPPAAPRCGGPRLGPVPGPYQLYGYGSPWSAAAPGTPRPACPRHGCARGRRAVPVGRRGWGTRPAQRRRMRPPVLPGWRGRQGEPPACWGGPPRAARWRVPLTCRTSSAVGRSTGCARRRPRRRASRRPCRERRPTGSPGAAARGVRGRTACGRRGAPRGRADRAAPHCGGRRRWREPGRLRTALPDPGLCSPGWPAVSAHGRGLPHAEPGALRRSR